jgi:hypothetical protein
MHVRWVAAAASAVLACAIPRPPGAADAPPVGAQAVAPAAAPAEWQPAIARADAAIEAFQRQLMARLTAAMKDGGPAAAVTVCRDEAPRVAAAVARDSGVALGRASDRLRNPVNVPPAWARAAVESAAGRPAAEVRPATFDLGDRVGVLRPIVVREACTRCHGAREAIAPEVAKRLSREYPQDRAVGYASGDHRGFFWAEAAK